MTKINLLLLASLMVTTAAVADGAKKKTKVSKLDDGKLHEYVRGNTGVLGGNLSLSFITDMAYGSQ